MKTGVELIAEERQRQVEEEGWTPEHDDEHIQGMLAVVGGLYAIPPQWRDVGGPAVSFDLVELMLQTPVARQWWNPKDRMRDLVRAGALIAAEIDRLQRLNRSQDDEWPERDAGRESAGPP
jgi:hypothetical protein